MSRPRQVDRQHELVAAAASLFEKKGYRGTSLQDIADAMGFTKGAVYYHVPSKQDLLTLVVGNVGDELLRAAGDQRIYSEPDPRTRLHMFCRAHVAGVMRSRTAFKVALHERSEIPKRTERVLHRRAGAYLKRLTDLIDDLHDRPAPDPVTTNVAARVLLSMLESAVDWYDPHGPLTLEDVATHVVTMFLVGIATDRSEPSVRLRAAADEAASTPALTPPVGNDELIASSAARLFRERGYRRTSIQQIADATGIAKPTIYRSFTSKDQILEHILLRLSAEMVAEVQASGESSITPAAEFQRSIHRHLDFIHEERSLYWVLLHDRSALTAEADRLLRADEQDYIGFWRSVLENGITTGHFRSDIDPVVISSAVLSSMNATVRWFRPGEPLGVGDLAGFLSDLVHAGYPDRLTPR